MNRKKNPERELHQRNHQALVHEEKDQNKIVNHLLFPSHNNQNLKCVLRLSLRKNLKRSTKRRKKINTSTKTKRETKIERILEKTKMAHLSRDLKAKKVLPKRKRIRRMMTMMKTYSSETTWLDSFLINILK